MNAQDELRDAIQTGIIDPIRQLFSKWDKVLAEQRTRLRVLTALIIINMIVSLVILYILVKQPLK